MPKHAVLRRKHPVALRRIVEEARRDTLDARCGEGLDPLRHGDAEILLAVDDEDRRSPAADEAMGREAIIELLRVRALPVRSAEVPIDEEKLLGRSIHALEVED